MAILEPTALEAYQVEVGDTLAALKLNVNVTWMPVNAIQFSMPRIASRRGRRVNLGFDYMVRDENGVGVMPFAWQETYIKLAVAEAFVKEVLEGSEVMNVPITSLSLKAQMPKLKDLKK